MRVALNSYPYFDYGKSQEVYASTPDELMQSLRFMRTILLNESDWTIGIDSPLPESVKQAWREWRSSMRDITDVITINNVENIVNFPEPPVTGRPQSWVNVEFKDGPSTIN